MCTKEKDECQGGLYLQPQCDMDKFNGIPIFLFILIKCSKYDGVFLFHFQLGEDSMVKLDRICREANVMLVFARSYGLTGFVRISLKVICFNIIIVPPKGKTWTHKG
jgi:hypothetical protein